jgi:DNA-binding response OmpR family regulator
MADKTKILIVEDDQYLLTMFRFALTTRGAEFDLITAFDADTALTIAREIKPDLILLDILLPGDVDGIEICRQLRSDPAMRGTGVVMVTALDDAATRHAAIEAGAADYWIKPINTRDLLDRVRALLGLKRFAPSRSSMPEPIEPRPLPRKPAAVNAPAPAGLDDALSALKSTFAQLEPADWAEIQALAEARVAYKHAKK